MRLLRNLASVGVMAIAGAMGAATLVRLAPGFDVDEREFDPRLSNTSIEALRESRSANRNLLLFYFRYFRAAAHGDFGMSSSLNRPVRELIRERGPVTLRLATTGLLAGWLFGIAFAIGATQSRKIVDFAASWLNALLLCLPAALIGIVILLAGGSWWWAIALIVFPKIFSYTRNLLKKVSREPHIILAHAKGLGKTRIFTHHIAPMVLPEMLALAGVSVSMALSAAVPVEAICDVPGVGQLAWQAALARDLPVLATVTLMLALMTRAANVLADSAIAVMGARRS